MLKRYQLTPRKGFRIIELDATDSTNDYLRLYRGEFRERTTVVTAEWQSAGRGATGQWQSEKGANLLLSMLIHPTMVEPGGMFVLSQTVCLAVCLALNGMHEGFTIKWPNDIYWGNSKVVGILIENELAGKRISDCVIGVGVNVNQREFSPNVPNPTSLALILGREMDRSQVLDAILREFNSLYSKIEEGRGEEVREEYLRHLYRKGEPHTYRDQWGEFAAVLETVEPSGHLVLLDGEGCQRRYAFKEVQFVI